MIIINPREVCAEILEDIAVNGSYSNIALKKALKQNGAMPPRDRAFVTENVNGTLRNIIYIDYASFTDVAGINGNSPSSLFTQEALGK